MADGFGVVTDALHGASQAAHSAAAQVHGIDVADPLTLAANALPGSSTQRSATVAAEAVTSMLEGWIEQAARYATALEASAASYRSADRAGADTLARTGPAFPELGGPVR